MATGPKERTGGEDFGPSDRLKPDVGHIGRPQGVPLAQSFLQFRAISQKGSNAVTVATRAREALVTVRTAVQRAFDEHAVIN